MNVRRNYKLAEDSNSFRYIRKQTGGYVRMASRLGGSSEAGSRHKKVESKLGRRNRATV